MIFTGQSTVVVVKVINFFAIGRSHMFWGWSCAAILVGRSVNHRSVCVAAPQVGAVQRIEGTVTEIRGSKQKAALQHTHMNVLIRAIIYTSKLHLP